MAQILHRNFVDLAGLLEDILKVRNNSGSIANDFAEKRKYAIMLFVLIKKINRNEKHKIRHGRENLQLEKVRVDSNRLQLQNLLYEINHLKREIRKCYNFRSNDEDLKLLSQEQYMNLLEMNEMTADSEFRRQNILECELKLRKQLSAVHKELLVSKKRIIRDIVSKTELLASFSPSLRHLIKSTRPLQESLNLPMDQEWKIHQLVQLLPKPLYIVYMKIYSLEDVGKSNISLSVMGCDTLVYEMEHSGHVKQLKDEIQSKLDGFLNCNSNSEFLFSQHPLTVQITVGNSGENDGYLNMTLRYFPHLNIVTAGSKIFLPDSDMDFIQSCDILNYIYPDDAGDFITSDVEIKLSKGQLTRHDLVEYLKSKELGKCYRWLQKVCGITTYTDLEKNNLNTRLCMEETLSAIKKIYISRVNLSKQIKSLLTKNIESLFEDDKFTLQPPSCSLVQWTSITYEEYASNFVTSRYIFSSCSNSNVYFRSVIVRGSAKMECFISISNKFPMESPTWALCVHWNGQFNSTNNAAIKVMENWTNSLESRDLKNSLSLLPAQLRRTMDSFDIFLETESTYHKPSEFNKEKPFIRSYTKRIRLLPYRFIKKTHTNLFKQ